jgi:hypothetical protein
MPTVHGQVGGSDGDGVEGYGTGRIGRVSGALVRRRANGGFVMEFCLVQKDWSLWLLVGDRDKPMALWGGAEALEDATGAEMDIHVCCRE